LFTTALGADEEFVVGDEPGVVSDETSPLSGWCLLECPTRQIDGRTVFVRRSAEAFDDPDARGGLELKYFFNLPSDLCPPHGNLSRGTVLEQGISIELSPVEMQEVMPASAATLAEVPATEAEWLDWRQKPKAKSLALLTCDEAGQAKLRVLEAAPDTSPLAVEKLIAERTFPTGELAIPHQVGGLLDACDRPALRPREAAFFGRVIAILKQIDGRYAVDLYGEKLHQDSDCRVLLTPVEHPWGRPVAVQFVEIPIRRSDGTIAPVSVLDVTYRRQDGALKHVGCEFPLCSTIALAQMRKMSSLIPKNAASQGRPAPDVRKLLGPDVAEELERRLVDGHYR